VKSKVYVYVASGQTLDRKRALVREMTDVLVRNFNIAPDAVAVRLIEYSSDLGGKTRSCGRRSGGNLH
jgi:4-oxalocrotonate tautomerase